MNNPTLTRDLVAIAQAAESAPHGKRGQIYEEAAQRLGVSLRTLHIKLKAVMLPARKQRKDAGSTGVPLDELTLISAVAVDNQRKQSKRLLPLGEIITELRANGEIVGGSVDEKTGEFKPYSLSTITRALFKHRLHPKQLLTASPAVQLASEHPNHVWQIDASLSAQFYLNEQGTHAMDKAVYYEGKQQNMEKIKNNRLWRYVITDHTSGTIFVEYVLGAESSENLCNCLINAMQKRGNNPFHGVPFIIMTDPGAAMTSASFRNLCNNLSIDLIINKVGNARAKGQVEQAHNIVERHFEGRLKLRPAYSLAELNTLAEKWSLHYNATAIHSRHKKSRFSAWLSIKPEQLRIAPSAEVCRELAVSAPVNRTVSATFTIPFKGLDYKVDTVPHVEVGDILQVTRNPWGGSESLQVILINAEGRKYFHSIPLVNKNEHGFDIDAPVIGKNYKQEADTITERNRKQLEQIITGESTEAGIAAARKSKKVAFDGRIDPFKSVNETVLPSYLPKKGSELKTAIELPQVVESNMDIASLATQLKRLLGEWTPELMAWLKKEYPEGAPESTISDIAERITKRPRLAVVGGSHA